MQKRHGEMTAYLGSELIGELWELGYAIHYDHGRGGDAGVGVSTAWIGGEKKRDNRLAEIDIAISERAGNRAILLVEIEESGDNPKKILGAAMAILLADSISSSDRDNLQIGPWTTLLILARGKEESHKARAAELESRLNQLSTTGAGNTIGVGHIRIILFDSQGELMDLIKANLNLRK